MADEVTRLRRSLGEGDDSSAAVAPTAVNLHKYVTVLLIALCVTGFVHIAKRPRAHTDDDPLFQPF